MFKSDEKKLREEIENLGKPNVKEMLKQIELAKKDINRNPKVAGYSKKERKMINLSFGSLLLLGFALFGFSSRTDIPQENQATVMTVEAVYASEVTVDTTSQEKPQEEPSQPLTIDPNSYNNFPEAVQVVGACQSNQNCRYMVDKWEAKYGYDADTIRMILITNKESGWQFTNDNTNKNGSEDLGFFQINTIHCSKLGNVTKAKCRELLLDPDTNFDIATQIFDAQGWNPWVARKAYLPSFWADRVTL